MSQDHLKKKQFRLKREKERLQARIGKIDELVNAIDRELNSRDPYFDQGPGVYVLKCHDVYKIGKADDLRTRLLGLQCGCPYKLDVVSFIPCSTPEAIDLESDLHKRFHEKEFRGEWFRLSVDDLTLLKSLCRDRGNGHLLNAFDESKETTDQFVLSTKKSAEIVMDSIRSVLKGKAPGEYAPLNEVLVECSRRGVCPEVARQIVDKLRRDGDVFEPRPGHVKVF